VVNEAMGRPGIPAEKSLAPNTLLELGLSFCRAMALLRAKGTSPMNDGRFPVLNAPDDSREIEDEVERRFALQEEFLGNDKPVNRIDPVVSVRVITYQHGDYIRQCLDSILAQETDFPFEIVIGEDQSIDGTREICIDYAERHPDRIRLFLRDRRLSLMRINGRVRRFNGAWARRACRGKYLAICEGDDYWINPRKLQMQVDMLEQDPDISLVHGEAHFYYQTTGRWSHNVHRQRQDLDISDGLFQALIEARYRVITCTAMYRKTHSDRMSTNEFYKRQCRFHIGDTRLWLELSRMGRFGYIDEPLGVYRLLDESASRSRDLTHMLSYELERLYFRVLYMEQYGVPEQFFKRIVKKHARQLLPLAGRLGVPDVAQELSQLMNKAGVRPDPLDRFYLRCASLAGGRILASFVRRVELRLARHGLRFGR